MSFSTQCFCIAMAAFIYISILSFLGVTADTVDTEKQRKGNLC